MLRKMVIASGLGLLAFGGIAMAQDMTNNMSQTTNTSTDNGYSTSNSSTQSDNYNGTSGSSYSNTNSRAGERG